MYYLHLSDGLAIVLKIFHSFVVHTFVNNVVEVSIFKEIGKNIEELGRCLRLLLSSL